ncbi:Phenylacetate-coenzyme A ligase [Sedimentisphaera cyanobacteriorum]|uniref:Phenylacetate-coenzyme A ligase n=1 Tax=Sedimentisphaera cyanobacteriorum TaxID=1940790 RepID=A0A1Q2HNB6_9BACT|nr:phenylacetate--CoA ligase [Sedimentisphaera cyanobacteriorum]AQQ08745.1 Phenylacetate-coenzyme A ligase [Sedimentisphaera cyanobacteriorum]
MQINFWNKQIETASRDEINDIQLRRLKNIVKQAYKSEFYKKKFHKAGIESPEDIKTLEDIQKFPFTTKNDLRQNYPAGLLASDFDDVVRIHSSSGTTGVPTVIYLSGEDMDCWTDLVARSLVATGCTKSDVFQNMMTYGLFTGGLGLHYGAERVGMAVLPIGGGNTIRQVRYMQDFNTTTLHITPSYLLHIYGKLDDFNTKIEDLSLKRAITGAEPHTEQTRKKLEELYNMPCYNSYGLSEMNGPGVAFECVYRNGMHIWEDGFIAEIINPETGEVLPDGEKGELVLTNLTRTAMPLLRYRTRDLCHIYDSDCPCGRTHRRLSRIMGRTDDMMIINGVNVFPSQIEEVVMNIPEVGTNYQIVLTKKGAIDKLIVKVEIYSKMFSGDASQLDSLNRKICEELKASIFVNPVVQIHEPGTLPTFEGKAKRVIDMREEI